MFRKQKSFVVGFGLLFLFISLYVNPMITQDKARTKLPTHRVSCLRAHYPKLHLYERSYLGNSHVLIVRYLLKHCYREIPRALRYRIRTVIPFDSREPARPLVTNTDVYWHGLAPYWKAVCPAISWRQSKVGRRGTPFHKWVDSLYQKCQQGSGLAAALVSPQEVKNYPLLFQTVMILYRWLCTQGLSHQQALSLAKGMLYPPYAWQGMTLHRGASRRPITMQPHLAIKTGHLFYNHQFFFKYRQYNATSLLSPGAYKRATLSPASETLTRRAKETPKKPLFPEERLISKRSESKMSISLARKALARVLSSVRKRYPKRSHRSMNLWLHATAPLERLHVLIPALQQHGVRVLHWVIESQDFKSRRLRVWVLHLTQCLPRRTLLFRPETQTLELKIEKKSTTLCSFPKGFAHKNSKQKCYHQLQRLGSDIRHLSILFERRSSQEQILSFLDFMQPYFQRKRFLVRQLYRATGTKFLNCTNTR